MSLHETRTLIHPASPIILTLLPHKLELKQHTAGQAAPYIQISRRLVIALNIARTTSSVDNFLGDWMRNSRPDLETVINAGVRLILTLDQFCGATNA